MTVITGLLILLSIFLTTGRNILSKSTSAVPYKSKDFFIIQSVLFFSGAVLLFAAAAPFKLSRFTLGLSFIYAALLISAQWNYTVALQSGNVGLCAAVYSFGFIIPTVSGSVFWNESLSATQLVGIALVVIIILILGKSSLKTGLKTSRFVFLTVAMLSSGGLGVVQKVQSQSAFKNERSLFVALAFLIAAILSFTVSLFVADRSPVHNKKHLLFAVGIGLCFAGANFLNTLLSGMLDSAVFFPLLNIGTILVSQILSILIFREKLNKKTAVILLLSIIAILLIGI